MAAVQLELPPFLFRRKKTYRRLSWTKGRESNSHLAIAYGRHNSGWSSNPGTEIVIFPPVAGWTNDMETERRR